jgi:hypothetical protein
MQTKAANTKKAGIVNLLTYCDGIRGIFEKLEINTPPTGIKVPKIKANQKKRAILVLDGIKSSCIKNSFLMKTINYKKFIYYTFIKKKLNKINLPVP